MTLLCIFLCIACYYDYRYNRIPNWLLVVMGAAELVSAYMNGGFRKIPEFCLVTLLVILAFYPLFKIGTVGAGDVKLFGLCSGYLPKEKILTFLFFSLLIALFFSLVHFWRQGDFKERMTYLMLYIKEVADSGCWRLYWRDKEEYRRTGICLAGPILLSILLNIGGFY